MTIRQFIATTFFRHERGPSQGTGTRALLIAASCAAACSSGGRTIEAEARPDATISSGGGGPLDSGPAGSGGKAQDTGGTPGTIDAGGDGAAGSSGGATGSSGGATGTGGGATGTGGAAEPPPASDGGVDAPVPLAFVGSSPTSGLIDVPRSVWVRLDFENGDPASIAGSVALSCGSATPEFEVHAVGTHLIVNPRGLLPADSSCTVSFPLSGDERRVTFGVTSDTSSPAIVPYDRNDTTRLAPFPDDFYLVADPSTPTGRRVDIRVPSVPSLAPLFDAAIEGTRRLDGMSPLSPITVTLPGKLVEDSIPTDAVESLDPFASVGLFDVDPASVNRGQRVPFYAIVRNDVDVDLNKSYSLVVFPAVPLEARGKYAFVVTNRALVSVTQPLQPSPFLARVMAGEASSADEQRLQPIVANVLSELERTSPPLHRDDVALVLGVSIRSVEDIPSDLLSIRASVQSAPPPAFEIDSVTADSVSSSAVAAIVQGRWMPVSWTADGHFVRRATSGAPEPGPATPVPFTLALPRRESGGAPLVLYQHEQPGSAEDEVPLIARSGLAAAGFAVIGFTDIATRTIGAPAALNQDMFLSLLTQKKLPDYLGLLPIAEQLSFLRLIPTLGSIDRLPLGAPDGVPEIEPSQPLGYLGHRQGAFTGAGLLAFAPEIHAAALAAGGGRFSGSLIHSGTSVLYSLITSGGSPFKALTHSELYAGLALIQMGFDHQDPMNLAARVSRAPLPIQPSARASVLLAEGIGDLDAPVYSVRSTAAALGISELAPSVQRSPFLPEVQAPVRANIDASTSGALVQFVPTSYPYARPTPGCSASAVGCAVDGAVAVEQRVRFFASALTGVPTISAP